MTRLWQGIAVPCFGTEPEQLIELGVRAEAAGFDGFFVWDHLVYTNDGDGPDVLDPWTVLSVVAARTERIRLGPMVTPVSRRRPWTLARQCATLDRLSHGRLIFGAGLGSPARGDFARFGEVADDRGRAELLDEGLDVFAGLLSGEPFTHSGKHYRIEPTRFRPAPVQRPRMPIWIGGILPARRPIARAARWDGFVPIRYVDRTLTRPSPEDIASSREAVRARRADLDAAFDLVVWTRVVDGARHGARLLTEYRDAGATWWIETGWSSGDWQAGVSRRIAEGPR